MIYSILSCDCKIEKIHEQGVYYQVNKKFREYFHDEKKPILSPSATTICTILLVLKEIIL